MARSLAAPGSGGRSARSFRRVTSAVDAVCALAADAEATTLDDVVAAVAAVRDKPIEIVSAQLGPGVCGQRRHYPDRDVIVLANRLPFRNHTLAHELGHIVFNHAGAPAREVTLEASDDLIAYMLSQRGFAKVVDDGADELAEWEAETFAGMLALRLGIYGGRGVSIAVLRFDEALG